MNEILNAIPKVDMNAMLLRRNAAESNFTDEEIAALTEIRGACDDFISTRIINLKIIAKMIAICGNDTDTGHFQMSDVEGMGYFLEEELEAISSLDYMKDVAQICLHKAELDAVKKLKGA
jgi:hypothetical protein